jgi:hypothetical protein
MEIDKSVLLWTVCNQQNMKHIKLLLNTGSVINSKEVATTPLNAICISKDVKSEFLDRGTDLNSVKGDQPLSIACIP